MLLKTKPMRSEAYRDWIQTLPSCLSYQYTAAWLCKQRLNDPHHIKGRGFGGTSKCDDFLCIPLTREEHDKLHNGGWESWEKANKCDQREEVVKTLVYARKVGVIIDSPDMEDYVLNEFMDRALTAGQEGLDAQLSVIADGFKCQHWIVDETRASLLAANFKARKKQ